MKRFFKLSIKFLFLFLFCAGLWLPQNAWAKSRIVAVEVQGNQGVNTQSILNQIESVKGSRLDRQKVNQDLIRIYRMGFFEDVRVDRVPARGGIKLVYWVQEKPPIEEILIYGNKKISTSKIRSAIMVREGAPPDSKRIADSKQKIKDLYESEDLKDASVDAQIEERSGRPVLVFNIIEKKGNVVRAVRFEGNKAFSDGKLRRMVKTKKKSFISFLTGSGKFSEEALERDRAFITYNYLNEGYMRVRVSQPKVEVAPDRGGMIVTFFIEEGEPYQVGNISIEGDILTTEEELLSLFNTFKGNIYSQKILEEDLTQVRELYGNQGYAFVNIVPQPIIRDAEKVADIRILIDKGQKIYVERINITGNTVTRDKVIRREMQVVENSLYNEKLLKTSKNRLERLGYFETVEISTPRGSADNRLVLNINVKEKPTGTFSVGAGFSSVESFLLTASISKNNFFGLGISGSINAQLSGRRQEFSFQFTDPYFLDTRWILSARGFRTSSRFEDFTRTALGGSLELGRRIFDYTSLSFGYQIEDLEISDFDRIVPEFFRENADGLTSSVSMAVRRDTRDNPLVTTKGSYFSLTTEYAGLGGDNDYFRVNANARYYQPLWKKTVLKFNARVGYIKSLNDEPVPLFERFFTGGVNSLRGYDFRSVGPQLTIPDSITGKDQEFVFGGNKLFIVNVEYEFPIYDPAGIRGVVFFDAGNAYAEDELLNPIKVRTNVGAGIRWISPLGPLRFEWGFPLNRRSGDDFSVFNFTIGSFF